MKNYNCMLDSSFFKDPLGIPRTKSEMTIAVKEGYIIPKLRNSELHTVDLLLDHVDLELKWYTPSLEALKFINFIRLCIGEEPENTNPKAHYFFIDCLFQSDNVKPFFDVRNIDYDKLKGNTLILATREFSKSILILYFILYMASEGKLTNFGRVNFGVYVSDRMEGNVKRTMETIETLYLSSPYLQSLFEETHFTDKQVTLVRVPKTKLEIKTYQNHIKLGGKNKTVPQRYKRMFKLQGIGSSGGRGGGSALQRPQFAIFDDMVANEKDAYSEAHLKSIDQTINSDIGKSLSGAGHFKILIGTAYHSNDPVYKRVLLGEYLSLLFPRAEKAPTKDLDKKDFISVWSDRHSYKKQRREYVIAERVFEKGDPLPLKSINQEYYMRVTSEHELLINPKKDIRWEDVSYVYKNAKDFTWFITTDFTTSSKVGANNSGCFLWARSHTGVDYLMEMSLRIKEIKQQYTDVLGYITKAMKRGARTVEVGVEIDGQQVLHLIALEEYVEKFKEPPVNYIDFAKQKLPNGKIASYDGIRSKGSGDKLWRLKLVTHKYKEGKVVFNKLYKETDDMTTLIDLELSRVTETEIKAKTDDGLDCLSQVALMDIDTPVKPVVVNAVNRLSPYSVYSAKIDINQTDDEYGNYV